MYDRVGGGDGFASGLFAGILNGEDEEHALRMGWAHGALLATTPGDTTMVSMDQVKVLFGIITPRLDTRCRSRPLPLVDLPAFSVDCTVLVQQSSFVEISKSKATG